MTVVGLTGSLGTGKSTVAGLFKELGAYVVDWDELARQVVCPHRKAWQRIVDCFGEGVLNEDLTINRQKLADIVFSDPAKLAELNRIVHPEVSQEDQRITQEIKALAPDALIIKDIPLLHEAACPISVDKTIVVAAREATQLTRLEAGGMTREDALKRIRSQIPLEEKIKSADFVIDNEGSLEETRRQVEKLYGQLIQGKRQSRHTRGEG